jgi:HD-like signal output (HDOD) protein/ActR/RegA family two-component response regulator
MADAKPVILFVDDERSVLDGLRRTLFGQRPAWDMLFAPGGAEALALMETRPVDVVVTDMRMPGMDGAALLDRVRRLRPEAARIVLSGYSEREAIFRTIGPAHQYFIKPCPTPVLVEAISRALEVRRLLRAPELLALVSGASSVPALPNALFQLLEELQSPDGSAGEVARIISSDVGLTAQLLKLTNSGFFYTSSAPVTDVHAAVRMLGFETVRAVAVLAGVFEAFHRTGMDLEVVTRLETRSLEIGALAQRIAEAENLPRQAAEQAQCAGMLSHVGSLMLFANWGEEMEKIGASLDQSGGDIIAVERKTLGASHPELGATLLGLWGFTDPMVEAVLFHHAPGQCPFAPQTGLSTLAVLHVAQHLIKPRPKGEAEEDFVGRGLDRAFLEGLGLWGRVPAWAALAAQVRKEYE